MERRPIDVRIEAGGPDPEEEGSGAHPDAFREVMSRWASGVAVVAVRDPDDARVYATTVSSFGSVSTRPPRIVISLGPGAQVLPFLKEGRVFAVNVLAVGQEALATRFTDSFPVGPSPFPNGGLPVISGAHAHLACTVESLVPVGSSRLVVGLVEEASAQDGSAPLLYYDRDYRELAD